MEIKRICAWCKKEMGEKEVPDDSKYEATHGICPDCREREFPKRHDNEDEPESGGGGKPESKG